MNPCCCKGLWDPVSHWAPQACIIEVAVLCKWIWIELTQISCVSELFCVITLRHAVRRYTAYLEWGKLSTVYWGTVFRLGSCSSLIFETFAAFEIVTTAEKYYTYVHYFTHNNCLTQDQRADLKVLVQCLQHSNSIVHLPHTLCTLTVWNWTSAPYTTWKEFASMCGFLFVTHVNCNAVYQRIEKAL